MGSPSRTPAKRLFGFGEMTCSPSPSMSYRSASVAHLSSAHPRDDIRIFHKECKSLVAAGHRVSLVIGDNLGDACKDGVYIYDVRKSAGRLSRVLDTTSRVLRRAVSIDADIYHLHDPELLWVGLELKGRGKVVIFDSHEDVPVQLLNKPYLPPSVLRLLSWTYAAFERFVCGRLDGIIAATPFICRRFLEINPRTIDVCNYPILNEFHPCANWSGKADEVCYVGGLSPHRGIAEIVSAMALLPGTTRLNLAGGFSEPSFRDEVCASPGWLRVNELGVVDRDGVSRVYERSLAGLVTLHPIPNYVDALPIKMFEYMSAGLPVIASDFPLWRDIIAGNHCGLCVDPLDPGAIGEAVRSLVASPDRAQAMGENGRSAVISKYNWQNEETKLLEFYQGLLASRH